MNARVWFYLRIRDPRMKTYPEIDTYVFSGHEAYPGVPKMAPPRRVTDGMRFPYINTPLVIAVHRTVDG